MGIFDLSKSIRAYLIIGIESQMTANRMEEIKSQLKCIYMVEDVIFITGLRGMYCITL